MNEPKSNHSEVRAEPAASKQPQQIKLGLDVHAESIVVARQLDQSAPQPPQRFTPAQFLIWIKTQVALAGEVHSCYEAGAFGFGLHRQLGALGVQNLVAQPIRLDEQHKKVNHDGSDALALLARLDRRVAGNPKALATVRVPSEVEEQKRIESRQREQLKREVQRVAAQGRSLLLSQGHREKNRWWQPARWEDLQPRLPAWLVVRLETFRRVLAILTAELAAATQALSAAAPAVRPKGLGRLTYQTLECEVGDWGRFQNRREVGSYTGLCGGVSASGPSRHQLSITKHGNARLRTALVEMAWRLVVWQPECKLVKKWAPVLTRGRATQAAKKKAIVAVARQMAVDLWRWRTGRVQPEALGWVMLA